jgi:hypothetical protein
MIATPAAAIRRVSTRRRIPEKLSARWPQQLRLEFL